MEAETRSVLGDVMTITMVTIVVVIIISLLIGLLILAILTVKNGDERLINPVQYSLIGRGLNTTNTRGYEPSVYFLDSVERSHINDYVSNPKVI